VDRVEFSQFAAQLVQVAFDLQKHLVKLRLLLRLRPELLQSVSAAVSAQITNSRCVTP
jgi:hypothetical protein